MSEQGEGENMKDYKALAAEILKLVGGEKNVAHLEHCSTRLRFSLVDSSKADVEKLKATKGVMSVIMTAQCQVVIGNDVIEVYDELMKLGKFGGSGNAAPAQEKQKIGAVILDFIVGVFQPLVPAIAGAGILKALLTVCTLIGIMESTDTIYKVFFYGADAALYFLPLMVAVTTATKLKCNKMVALAVVGSLMLPNMTAMISEGASLFGMQLQNIAYTYQVFPAILSVLFLALVEKYATKISPKPVRVFLVPMICFILVVPVTLLILGPFGYNVGTLLTSVILAMYSKFGWLAVAVLAAILPIMVSAGMHKALLPYALSSISELGYEVLYMSASLAHNISESGACFAVALRSKDSDMRSTAFSAAISALFGITEPALYGVTLQNKRVLSGVMAGSFVSGILLGLMGVKAFVAMGPGLAGMAMYVDPDNSMNIIWAFAGFGLAIGISFLVTFLIYKETAEEETTADKANSKAENAQAAGNTVTMSSPLEGEVIALENVKDEVFRSGVLGQGVAVVPAKGELYAPVDGVISTVMDTKHAISMISDDGAEILMHIGMDTVQLEGKGFESAVSNGEKVKAGQLLMKFDMDMIKGAGYDLTTPVVVLNLDKFELKETYLGKVAKGAAIMELEVKA